MYIADQEMLEAFVARACSSTVLAIDTEFLREKTYYARLCLLQMATDKEDVVIDPFAVDDLSVISPLLQNDGIVKLFHAGSQDIEILYREVGVLPRPVFDTQIAAALLGHTQQIGYAALVHAMCDVQLKKMESFTDWSRRPLSKPQIKYAADDVIYLPVIYRKMRQALTDKGRLSWLDQDFEALIDAGRYENAVDERYKRLKRVSQLSRQQLSAAREFAAWREREAQRRDMPRKWVVTDEQVVEACKREARTIDSLFMVRGMKDRLSMQDARKVVELIEKGLDAPRSTWPELDRSKKNEPNVDIELDLMNALVHLRAKENGVAFQTLASHDDLSRVARGYTKDVELLKGWRRSLVGEELLQLIEGKLCLSIEKGMLKVTNISQSSEEGIR